MDPIMVGINVPLGKYLIKLDLVIELVRIIFLCNI